MSDFIGIEVDISSVIRQLTELGKLKFVRAALLAGANHIKSKISPYPPASVANSPQNPTGRWYERGYGPKWRTRAGVNGRKTSETLGRKWTVKSLDGGMTAVVGVNTSYAEYVHSAEKQAWFHKVRGWKTDEQVIREEGATVTQFIEERLQKEIKQGG